MNLFTIPAEFRAWSDAVEAAGGEMTAELEAKLGDIESTLEFKADAVCALIREAEREGDAYRAEAAAFYARARTCENRVRALKHLLKAAMKAVGASTVKGRRFTATVATAAIPQIRWVFAGPPPEWCRRTIVEVDGGKAHEAYKFGASMEGFEVTFTESLRIK